MKHKAVEKEVAALKELFQTEIKDFTRTVVVVGATITLILAAVEVGIQVAIRFA